MGSVIIFVFDLPSPFFPLNYLPLEQRCQSDPTIHANQNFAYKQLSLHGWIFSRATQ